MHLRLDERLLFGFDDPALVHLLEQEAGPLWRPGTEEGRLSGEIEEEPRFHGRARQAEMLIM